MLGVPVDKKRIALQPALAGYPFDKFRDVCVLFSLRHNVK
jgi:hypothetical protein